MSTLDDDGCGWISLSPGCPELAAGELEAEDLAEAGVPTSWGTGSDVEDQALAGRLAETTAFIAALPSAYSWFEPTRRRVVSVSVGSV